MIRATWGEQSGDVSRNDELSAIIESIRLSGQPTMLFLEHESGKTLVIGIGREESVLTLVEDDGTSYQSLGDTNRSGRLIFLCRDQLDEFMEEMAVPEQDAIRAAHEFVQTGKTPTMIRWEPDW